MRRRQSRPFDDGVEEIKIYPCRLASVLSTNLGTLFLNQKIKRQKEGENNDLILDRLAIFGGKAEEGVVVAVNSEERTMKDEEPRFSFLKD